MSFKHYLGISLALALCVAETVRGEDPCEAGGGGTMCTAPDYPALFPTDMNGPGGNCPGQNGAIVCMSADSAPAPASLICDPATGALHCEAWPQGQQMTYRWSGVNVSIQTADAANPNAYLTCAGKPGRVRSSVSVIVTAMNGQSASTTLELTCPK